jgi:hypothetical protein
MEEIKKNYIIKTNIGYFCKEYDSLVTKDITRSTLMSKAEAGIYLTGICNNIAAKNLKQIEAEILMYNRFQFEIGKYYENTDGLKVHILCVAHTTVYGKCLIAETNAEMFLPLSLTEEATIGFIEIPKERWMIDFKAVGEIEVIQ